MKIYAIDWGIFVIIPKEIKVIRTKSLVVIDGIKWNRKNTEESFNAFIEKLDNAGFMLINAMESYCNLVHKKPEGNKIPGIKDGIEKL